MVRTVELILGLQPLRQFDAAALPMWRTFSSKLARLEALRPAEPRAAANQKTTEGAEEGLAPRS